MKTQNKKRRQQPSPGVKPTRREVFLLAMHGHPADLTRVTLRFHPGEIAVTPGARQALARSQEKEGEFLQRHLNGDWGVVDADCCLDNEESIQSGCPILSAYETSAGDCLLIVTENVGEAPLSSLFVTTILLPKER